MPNESEMLFLIGSRLTTPRSMFCMVGHRFIQIQLFISLPCPLSERSVFLQSNKESHNVLGSWIGRNKFDWSNPPYLQLIGQNQHSASVGSHFGDDRGGPDGGPGGGQTGHRRLLAGCIMAGVVVLDVPGRRGQPHVRRERRRGLVGIQGRGGQHGQGGQGGEGQGGPRGRGPPISDGTQLKTPREWRREKDREWK